MGDTTTRPDAGADANIWNHHPMVPIKSGGIFRQLSNPFAVIKGIFMSWFGLYRAGSSWF